MLRGVVIIEKSPSIRAILRDGDVCRALLWILWVFDVTAQREKPEPASIALAVWAKAAAGIAVINVFVVGQTRRAGGGVALLSHVLVWSSGQHSHSLTR